jgi:hypothetical protein
MICNSFPIPRIHIEQFMQQGEGVSAGLFQKLFPLYRQGLTNSRKSFAPDFSVNLCNTAPMVERQIKCLTLKMTIEGCHPGLDPGPRKEMKEGKIR